MLVYQRVYCIITLIIHNEFNEYPTIYSEYPTILYYEYPTISFNPQQKDHQKSSRKGRPRTIDDRLSVGVRETHLGRWRRPPSTAAPEDLPKVTSFTT